MGAKVHWWNHTTIIMVWKFLQYNYAYKSTKNNYYAYFIYFLSVCPCFSFFTIEFAKFIMLKFLCWNCVLKLFRTLLKNPSKFNFLLNKSSEQDISKLFDPLVFVRNRSFISANSTFGRLLYVELRWQRIISSSMFLYLPYFKIVLN